MGNVRLPWPNGVPNKDATYAIQCPNANRRPLSPRLIDPCRSKYDGQRGPSWGEEIHAL
jgi:hypothetical protein